jgi:hypothetical protein
MSTCRLGSLSPHRSPTSAPVVARRGGASRDSCVITTTAPPVAELRPLAVARMLAS